MLTLLRRLILKWTFSVQLSCINRNNEHHLTNPLKYPHEAGSSDKEPCGSAVGDWAGSCTEFERYKITLVGNEIKPPMTKPQL